MTIVRQLSRILVILFAICNEPSSFASEFNAPLPPKIEWKQSLRSNSRDAKTPKNQILKTQGKFVDSISTTSPSRSDKRQRQLLPTYDTTPPNPMVHNIHPTATQKHRHATPNVLSGYQTGDAPAATLRSRRAWKKSLSRETRQRAKTAEGEQAVIPSPQDTKASTFLNSDNLGERRQPPVKTPRVAKHQTPNVTAKTHELPPPNGQHRIPMANQSGRDAERLLDIQSDGEWISLVVRDAAVKDVLALIAQTQKINIVCADSTGGSPTATGTPGDNLPAGAMHSHRITLALENVRIEDALDAILTVAGYTWLQKNGIIYVTSLAVANRLPADIQGRETRIFVLNFSSAVDVDQTIKGSLLSAVGNSFVSPSSRLDHLKTREVIVVEDLPSYLSRIEEYIAQVDQPPLQVMIEAYVLQIQLDDDCRHGVNYDQLFRARNHQVRLQTNGFANPSASHALFVNISGDDINALVEMLQTTTDTRTLASPRILCVNGQQSTIQIGEKLGYRVLTTTQTSTLEDVRFLDVGVVLQVTPRITRDHRVLMNVKPKVSGGQINLETGLPDEDTTQVETDVLLSNGCGMVIGGLIKETDSNTQSKIPGLGDLRIVGSLFQRREKEKSRSEIIIVLVPHVLPYDPIHSERNHEEVQRATTPLFHGPLNRVPRPEPRMPDSLENPGPRILRKHNQHTRRCHHCQRHHEISLIDETPYQPAFRTNYQQQNNISHNPKKQRSNFRR